MISSSSVENAIKASLWTLIIAFVFVAIYGVSEWRDGKLSEERESITEIMVGEQYDTENVILLKELEDKEDYLKYELLVEGKIKQAIHVKDTSEVVIIE